MSSPKEEDGAQGGETPPLRGTDVGPVRCAESYEHRGWYTPRKLPHFDSPEIAQSITFRLHDSLPAAVLAARAQESDDGFRRRIDAALDTGHGVCLLRDERLAAVVVQALRHGDRRRYTLHAYVVMPNHVHVLITPFVGVRLAEILHTWKSWSAKEINRIRGAEGAVWRREYFDRFIRDEAHFHRAREYIENNPVAAGLVARSGDWRFSSASCAAVAVDGGETPPLRCF